MPTQSRVKQKGEKKVIISHLRLKFSHFLILEVIFSHLRLISSPELDFPLCCPTYSCPAAADNEDAAQDDNEDAAQDDNEEFRNAARHENEEARP